MALSSIVSEIKRDINRKLQFFFILTAFDGCPRQNIVITFGVEKLKWCGYPMVKKFDYMFSRFDRIPTCDRRTDRRTSCDSIVCAVHSIARKN